MAGDRPAHGRPAAPAGRMGLTGMRERIGALGGHVRLRDAPRGGALLELDVPLSVGEAP